MKPEPPENELPVLPIHLDDPAEVPAGVDRRAFMMRTAVIGAVAVLAGCSPDAPPAGAPAAGTPPAPPKGQIDVTESQEAMT